MKQIQNRQKMIVKPNERVEKHLMRGKDARRLARRSSGTSSAVGQSAKRKY